MKKILLFSALALLLAACGHPTAENGKRVVTVTIEPLRYFVERIAADRFTVSTMVPAGGNPETYEPSAQQLIALAESPLYIKVGSIGFERTWADKLQTNAPGCTFVSASDGVETIKDEHGDDDPHTWMSPKNALVMAENICKALVQTDPADSAFFRQNLAALKQDILSTDQQVRTILGNSQTAFLVYHPVLTYFARDYGLKQLSVEREGREPSVADLKGIIAKARQSGVETFFVQQEFANRNIDVVLGSIHARRVVINPLSYDWCREMLNIANHLKTTAQTD